MKRLLTVLIILLALAIPGATFAASNAPAAKAFRNYCGLEKEAACAPGSCGAGVESQGSCGMKAGACGGSQMSGSCGGAAGCSAIE